ncbi:MAG: NUDIX domain-containing protein [archaeon]
MEKEILELFLFNNKLKFSEIGKLLNIRTNKLAYHLNNLVKKGILVKDKQSYFLSDISESLIPYLSDKKAVLPVILVLIGDKKKAYLYKRSKRPFKGYFSLPGGRIQIGESISDATKRIMKKFGIKAKLGRVNSVSLEHVKKKGKIIHSFMLIFVTATSKDNVDFVSVERKKRQIIKSDYYLLRHKSDEELDINTIFSID